MTTGARGELTEMLAEVREMKRVCEAQLARQAERAAIRALLEEAREIRRALEVAQAPARTGMEYGRVIQAGEILRRIE